MAVHRLTKLLNKKSKILNTIKYLDEHQQDFNKDAANLLRAQQEIKLAKLVGKINKIRAI